MIHVEDDGFGNVWQCRHSLSSEHCCMEIVRPGHTQCVCDGPEGVRKLIEHLLAALPEGRYTEVGHINVNEYGFLSAHVPDLKTFKVGTTPIYVCAPQSQSRSET